MKPSISIFKLFLNEKIQPFSTVLHQTKSNHIENISCVTKCDLVSDRQTDGLRELLELLFATKKTPPLILEFQYIS